MSESFTIYENWGAYQARKNLGVFTQAELIARMKAGSVGDEEIAFGDGFFGNIKRVKELDFLSGIGPERIASSIEGQTAPALTVASLHPDTLQYYSVMMSEAKKQSGSLSAIRWIVTIGWLMLLFGFVKILA